MEDEKFYKCYFMSTFMKCGKYLSSLGQSDNPLTSKFKVCLWKFELMICNLPIFSINSAASSASLWKKVLGKSLHGGIDAPYPLGSNATTVNLLERPSSCGPKSDRVEPSAPGRQSIAFGELPDT